MKTVNINLNIVSILPNSDIQVFKNQKNDSIKITEAGNYKYTFTVEDNDICGIEVLTSTNSSVNINTNLQVYRMFTQNFQKVNRRINIKEAGDYDIAIDIT